MVSAIKLAERCSNFRTLSVLLESEIAAKAKEVLETAASAGADKTAKRAVPTEAPAATYFMSAGKQH